MSSHRLLTPGVSYLPTAYPVRPALLKPQFPLQYPAQNAPGRSLQRPPSAFRSQSHSPAQKNLFWSRKIPYCCATFPCGQKSHRSGVCVIARLDAHAFLQGRESALIPTGTQLSDASISRLSSGDFICAAQYSVHASG